MHRKNCSHVATCLDGLRACFPTGGGKSQSKYIHFQNLSATCLTYEHTALLRGTQCLKMKWLTLSDGALAIQSLTLPVPDRNSLNTDPSGARLVSSGTSFGKHTPPYGAPTRRPYLRLRKHSAVDDTRYRTWKLATITSLKVNNAGYHYLPDSGHHDMGLGNLPGTLYAHDCEHNPNQTQWRAEMYTEVEP